MKHSIRIILLLLSFKLSAQHNTSDLITKISKADTVYFTVDNSGCFDAYIRTYKFCKARSGVKKIMYTTDTAVVTKKITVKNYKAFIKNYKVSVHHFNDPEVKGMCTNTSEFEIRNKNKSVKFKNTTCEAEFNPEMFLMKLMK